MAKMPTSGFNNLGLYEQNRSFGPQRSSTPRSPIRSKRDKNEEDLSFLLEDVERKIRRGDRIKARDLTKLVNKGLLEMPRDYELQGSDFVRVAKGSLKTKTQLDLGYTPTSAIGGGGVFGSGPRGALTGEDVRRELATSEANRRAQQESFLAIPEARSRVLGAQAFAPTVTPKTPTLSKAGLELEAMKAKTAKDREQVLIFGKGRKSGRSMAERNFEKWKEENPAAAIELELRQSQEARLAGQAQSKEERAKRAADLRRQISDEIKSGKYDPEIIAILNELKSESYKEGTDVETIFIQAQALFESATKERAQALQEQLDKETRDAAEWDRQRQVRRSEQEEDDKLARDLANMSAAQKSLTSTRTRIESAIRRARERAAFATQWLSIPEKTDEAAAVIAGAGAVIKDLEAELAGLGGGGEMPQVGDIVDGWEFLGGDPSNQNSWRQVR